MVRKCRRLGPLGPSTQVAPLDYNAAMPRWARILLATLGTTVAGAVLGAVLGIAAAVLVVNWPSGWRSLGVPPHPAMTVIAGDEFTVFVHDATGNVYRCELEAEGNCWQPWSGEIPTPDPNEACGPEFRIEPPGGGPVDYTFSKCFAEFTVGVAYRLRADGGVEVWSKTTSSWNIFLFGIFPMFGIAIGGVIGFLGGLVGSFLKTSTPRPA